MIVRAGHGKKPIYCGHYLRLLGWALRPGVIQSSRRMVPLAFCLWARCHGHPTACATTQDPAFLLLISTTAVPFLSTNGDESVLAQQQRTKRHRQKIMEENLTMPPALSEDRTVLNRNKAVMSSAAIHPRAELLDHEELMTLFPLCDDGLAWLVLHLCGPLGQ